MKSYAITVWTGSQGVACAGHPHASPLVLVAEDHEDTRLLLRYVLERRGYRVVEAEDGEEAVRQAAALAPDLILMDVGLPRTDGPSATRRIRGRDESHVIPVVFLTGRAYPADREAAFAAGCDDYLVKPVDIDQLDCVLEKHLKPQEGRAH